MPAKGEATAALPGRSPVCDEPVIVRVDGGQLSPDGGVSARRIQQAPASTARLHRAVSPGSRHLFWRRFPPAK
jgi:hypothetical protein